MLPACLFSLPLHLWLMKDDVGGGGQRREFLSSAILVLVWGLQTALGQGSGCFWSGQSCCPCPAISPAPSPHHVYTHKWRQSRKARLQILFWDFGKHQLLGLDLLFPGSLSESELLGKYSGKGKMLPLDPSA